MEDKLIYFLDGEQIEIHPSRKEEFETKYPTAQPIVEGKLATKSPRALLEEKEARFTVLDSEDSQLESPIPIEEFDPTTLPLTSEPASDEELKKYEEYLNLQDQVDFLNKLEDAKAKAKEKKADTFLQKVDNSITNIGLGIRGFDDRLTLASQVIYRKIFGEENYNKFLENPDINDFWKIGMKDEDLADAYKEIKLLEAERGEVGSITEGFKKGDIGEIGAGIINGVSSLGESLAINYFTAGAGIYTDFFARAFVNVNEAKAERLGTDILTLVDEDKADFWTPLATGTLAGISERFGLGKVQAAMGKVTTGALNTIANRLVAGTAEGLTEYVQHGLEVVEESIGKGNDAEKVAFDFVDGLTSQEGLESFLQGMAGGGLITTASTAKPSDFVATASLVAAAAAGPDAFIMGSNIAPAAVALAAYRMRSPSNKKEIETLLDDIKTLKQEKTSSKDKEFKNAVDKAINEKRQKVAEIVKQDNKEINGTSEEDLKELGSIKDLTNDFVKKSQILNNKLRVEKSISQKEYNIQRQLLLDEFNANKQLIKDKLGDISLKNKNIADKNEKLITIIKTSENPAAIEKAKNDLVKNNIGYVEKLIKSTFNPTLKSGLTEQDYRAAINLEFAKIINTYKPIVKGKKIPFGAYLQQTLPKRLPAIFDLAIETTPEGEMVAKTDVTQEKDIVSEQDLNLETAKPETTNKIFQKTGLQENDINIKSKEILKGKLPGLEEQVARDKNPFLTAIEKASEGKFFEDIYKKLGGNFNNKNKAEWKSWLNENIDDFLQLVEESGNKDYNRIKNKMLKALYKGKKVGRAKTKEGGTAAGEGRYEYQTPTREEAIEYFSEGNLTTVVERKKTLTKILAHATGKKGIANVIQDPDIQKEFKSRQELQGKKVPKDFASQVIAKLDRLIKSVDEIDTNVLSSGPISPAALKIILKGALQIMKTSVKAGDSIFKALAKAINYIKSKIKNPKVSEAYSKIIHNNFKQEKDIEKAFQKTIDDIIRWNAIQEGNVNDILKLHNLRKVYQLEGKVQNKKDIDLFIKDLKENIFPLFPEAFFKPKSKFINYAAATPYFNEQIMKALKEQKVWGEDFKNVPKNRNGVYTFKEPKNVVGSTENEIKNNFENGSIEKQNNINTAIFEQMWERFNKAIENNPKNAIAIASYLKLSGNLVNHPQRIGAKVVGYQTNVKGKGRIYEMEHAMPNVAAYMYLLDASLDKKRNFKSDFKLISKNYTIIALGRNDNVKLGKTDLKDKMPANWTIFDNWFDRYFNKEIVEKTGGIDPASIIMLDGKNLAETYNITSIGRELEILDNINKENAKQTYEERDLESDFNDIIEQKTGDKKFKQYKEAKGKARGRKVKRGFWDYIIPPGAEDLSGLMYTLLPKGKAGEAAQEWMKQNIFRPYAVAIENINKERIAMMNDFVALKKKLKNIPSELDKEILNGDYTNEDAIRVYIWARQGMEIPGMSKKDIKELVAIVNKNKDFVEFASQLININKGDGYAKPSNNWITGTIKTDLLQSINTTKRQNHMQQWKENMDRIFTDAVMNKLEAKFGARYVEALNDMLRRMESGTNRIPRGNRATREWLDWLNNSVGAIMFINVKSAVLQTISSVNYMNWHDNNPLKAAQAFANQKQYWSDFMMIFNSDYLLDRRGGLKLNVQESELADMAKRKGVKGTISYLLNKGFILTRMADSFAIASGGAAMYRNRVNSYLKKGLSQKEAEAEAFRDFRELTEEAQQSSRPDRISQQQASDLGRVILAFANTPMQYTRLMKRSAQDLIAGRGDAKTHISKIVYYGFVQNLLFNAMQQALFSLGFEDEDEEEFKNKYANVANGMADSLLRGLGTGGAIISAGKNVIIDIAKRAQRPRPNFGDAAWKLFDISPPLDSKVTKIRGALKTFDYDMDKVESMGLSLSNPAAMAGAQTISALTNVPVDRAIRIYNNVSAGLAEDTEVWQRIALLLGWSTWELGMDNDDVQTTTSGIKRLPKKRKSISRRKTKSRR
jgi:hypothetical protein